MLKMVMQNGLDLQTFAPLPFSQLEVNAHVT